MHLNNEAIEVLLANRVFLYHLFGRIFAAQPNQELLEQLQAPHASEAIALIDTQISAQYAALLDSLESTPLDRLESEYTYLMIGPGKLPAPLWESIYITGENTLFQAHTLEVREDYRRSGFAAAHYQSEADDHIAIELDFMANLAKRAFADYIQQDEQKAVSGLADSRTFLRRHLLLWIDQFAELWGKQEKTGDFYPLCAQLIARICTLDEQLLEKLLEQ